MDADALLLIGPPPGFSGRGRKGDAADKRPKMDADDEKTAGCSPEFQVVANAFFDSLGIKKDQKMRDKAMVRLKALMNVWYYEMDS